MIEGTEQGEIAEKYAVKCGLTTLDEKVTGAFEEIKAEFDYRTYRRFEIKFGQSYDSRDSVRLAIRPRCGLWRGAMSGIGVTLFVESGDNGWTKQVLAQVSDELEHGRPRWTWLYTTFGGFVYVWAATLAFAFTFKTLYQRFGNLDQLQLTWASAGSAFVLGIFMQLTAWPIMAILPPVEIHPDGATPRGARSVAFVMSVIVVPLIISLLLAQL